MYTIYYSYCNTLIKLTFTGKVSLNMFLKVSSEILKHCEKQRLFLLADFRKAKFDFGPREVKEIVNILLNKIKPGTIIYEAVLIDSPMETAIVTLISKRRNQTGFQTKVFIKETSALEWLRMQS